MRLCMCPKDIDFAKSAPDLKESIASAAPPSRGAIFSVPPERQPDRFFTEPLDFASGSNTETDTIASVSRADRPLPEGWINTPWGPRPA